MISPKESSGTRTLLNRCIIFAFMVMVGFSMAKAIQYQSTIGIVLSIVSLGAGIYFLYLLARVKYEREQEETA